MSLSVIGKMAAVILAALALYLVWQRFGDPADVVSTSNMTIADPNEPGLKVVIRTRVVRIDGIETPQVQLPGGSWSNCDGNCVDKYRKEATAPRRGEAR